MTTVDHLDLDGHGTPIALTHTDNTWHSEHMSQRIWHATNQPLDRHNQLTQR